MSQGGYVTVPNGADVEALILVEIVVEFADEEGFLDSSPVPVRLSADDTAAFPVDPVVVLYGVLCHTRFLYLSIPAVPSMF